MSVSIGGVAKSRDGQAVTADWAEAGYEVHDRAWRDGALVGGDPRPRRRGLLFTPQRAGAATVFGLGQVFASVGNSQVNIYDPVSDSYLTTLTDNTGGTIHRRQRVDSQGNSTSPTTTATATTSARSASSPRTGPRWPRSGT